MKNNAGWLKAILLKGIFLFAFLQTASTVSAQYELNFYCSMSQTVNPYRDVNLEVHVNGVQRAFMVADDSKWWQEITGIPSFSINISSPPSDQWHAAGTLTLSVYAMDVFGNFFPLDFETRNYDASTTPDFVGINKNLSVTHSNMIFGGYVFINAWSQ
jgi:hypothetical protein